MPQPIYAPLHAPEQLKQSQAPGSTGYRETKTLGLTLLNHLFADDAYLAGCVAKLKEPPQDPKGRIVYHSPARKFAFGFMHWRCDQRRIEYHLLACLEPGGGRC